MEVHRHFQRFLSKGWIGSVILCLVALACSLPRFTPTVAPSSPEPTEIPLPTPTPRPLPPRLVETSPLRGEKLALDGAIKLYFNQAMDTASVEAALSSHPKVPAKLEWENAATLIYRPLQQLAPQTTLRLAIDQTAKAQNGLPLSEAISLEYETAPFLRLAQRIPENNAQGVRADTAVVAAFNQPVVPLGDAAAGPPAFTILSEEGEPVEGSGEWVNTSTYLFRARPAFPGGKTYRVQFNPNLKSLSGAPLQPPEEEWTFSVAPPRVIEIFPRDGENKVLLDSKIILTFDQPMDTSSVEAAFSLRDGEGKAVDGRFEWNADATQLTFTPLALLQRNHPYTTLLGSDAQALGGTALRQEVRAEWRTLPPFDLLYTNPPHEGEKPPHEAVWFYFSSPLEERNLEEHFRVSPAVSNLSVWWDDQAWAAAVTGDFDPSRSYTIEVAPELSDLYGQKLGRSVRISFRTAPLPPNLSLTAPNSVLLLTSDETSVPAQAVNLPRVQIGSGSLSLEEFIRLQNPLNYSYFREFRAADHQSWEQIFELATNQAQPIAFSIQPNGQPRSPGLYYLDLEMPQERGSHRYLLVVSDIHLTFKLSPQEALVWAVESRNLTPLANAPIAILDESGAILAQGQTDSQGIFRKAIPAVEDPWKNFYAVAYQPGHPQFGMAMLNWNSGVESWSFGIPFQFSPPSLKLYLYTDRPIYRPGQTVYLRAVLRQAFNAQYTLPEVATLPLRVLDPLGRELAYLLLPLSEFGCASGEFTLSPDAPPGTYSIESPLAEYQSVFFGVAAYRKPQIELTLAAERDHLQAGENLTVRLSARYFFDAPAPNLPIRWALYWQEASEPLEGYSTGEAEKFWSSGFTSDPMFAQMALLTNLLTEGEARTDADGFLELSIPTEKTSRPRQYVLEVTATDESGLPVSGRTTVLAHPSPLIIGIRPQTQLGKVNQPLEAEVLVTDWNGQPLGRKTLYAEFATLRWVRDETRLDPFGMPLYLPQTERISSADLVTAENGLARLSFTPQKPGDYLLSVSGEGARSSVILWVSGSGEFAFPELPNQRISLATDRENYAAGETARVFVPNPFSTPARALISLERGTTMSHEVRSIPVGGEEIEYRLSAEDVPNVYLSVTLLGKLENGRPDFRQGYAKLRVSPSQQTLQVSATVQPQRAAPGEEVTLDIQVQDALGKAAQGEFSVAVVDKAIYALAEPNAPSILEAFYGEHPLGVRTGLALAVAAWRSVEMPSGVGGGGQGETALNVVRQRFADTALWIGDVVTDSEGKAEIKLRLPDNVTTWKILVRGVDKATRVGESEIELVATKPLLIQPVTPRVWVAGDHLRLAAVLHNYTSQPREVQVTLQSASFQLDEGQAATQTVFLSPNGRQRVEWWGKVATQGSMEILFSAQAGELSDQVRIGGSETAIQQVSAKQSFSTAGILEIAGQREEVLSLPQSVAPQGGFLRVELTSSLASMVLEGVKTFALFENETTEYVLSKVLLNLAAYRLLKEGNAETPFDLDELRRATQAGIQRLVARQRFDGSWSWWGQDQGEPLITAYVLFGLSQAQAEGFTLPKDTLDRAVQYLISGVIRPAQTANGAMLDRLAFIHFALAQAGAADSAALDELFERHAQLNPWAQALLAWALETVQPGSEQAQTLRADLEGQALRSSSGACWQEKSESWRMASYQVTVTAMVLYALASYDASTPLVADAVRYLISTQHPSGGWGSSFGTAWAYLALSEVLTDLRETQSDFAFSALVNGMPLIDGSAQQYRTSTAVGEIPLERLQRHLPNTLEIQRQAGQGRLYYRAILQAFVPIASSQPVQRGFSISRAYRILGQDCGTRSCPTVNTAKAGTRIEVRVTLTVEKDAYYVVVQDYIPAGSEILDTRLSTTQFGLGESELSMPESEADPTRPLEKGWQWQYFSQPLIYDDYIVWSAEYLPAGTYELRYLITLLQPGEYHLRPAQAWELYFPEVQGSSAGGMFTILP